MYLVAKTNEIRTRRKEVGLTQSELSILAGFGACNTSIYRIESSLHKVHPLRAKALAEVLGCKVDDLFEDAEREVS